MNVIERAEQRLNEEERQHELGADNRYDLHYWAAYLDGARAQKKAICAVPIVSIPIHRGRKNQDRIMVLAFFSQCWYGLNISLSYGARRIMLRNPVPH